MLILLAAALWPVSTPIAGPRLRASEHQQSDLGLYRAIIARMRAGEGYYPAAADELRKDDYPLKPFITFRLPTQATLYARLGEPVMIGIEALLALTTLIVWWRRLGEWPLVIQAAGVILFAAGTGGLVEPVTGLFHESWAALLMALSIGLRRPGHATPAIVAAGAALMMRETALPMVLMMGGMALIERRWKEALGWAVPVILFALYLAWHAHQVAAVLQPGDRPSPGWQALLGLRFALKSLGAVSWLSGLVYPAAATVLILSLAGWLSVDRGWALRVGLLLAGYAAMLALFSRPDTFYWGLLAAPLSLMGLAFLPRAAVDLAQALRRVPLQAA